LKVKGAGVGGCDITLQPGEENAADCWCLWGTLNYEFTAYNIPLVSNAVIQDSNQPADIVGETICNDLSSLGNCYESQYVCTINSEGLCHCHGTSA
jgi:hypothetical protein